MIATLQSLRRDLHQHPELSGREVKTAARICDFIREHYPTEVIENIGGPGLAAVYDFGRGGRTVVTAARKNGFKLREQAVPFRFGEDFGWLSREYKVAMFGLGVGEDCPALHDDQYDFPEEVLPVGVGMFASLIDEVLG